MHYTYTEYHDLREGLFVCIEITRMPGSASAHGAAALIPSESQSLTLVRMEFPHIRTALDLDLNARDLVGLIGVIDRVVFFACFHREADVAVIRPTFGEPVVRLRSVAQDRPFDIGDHLTSRGC